MRRGSRGVNHSSGCCSVADCDNPRFSGLPVLFCVPLVANGRLFPGNNTWLIIFVKLTQKWDLFLKVGRVPTDSTSFNLISVQVWPSDVPWSLMDDYLVHIYFFMSRLDFLSYDTLKLCCSFYFQVASGFRVANKTFFTPHCLAIEWQNIKKSSARFFKKKKTSRSREEWRNSKKIQL